MIGIGLEKMTVPESGEFENMFTKNLYRIFAVLLSIFMLLMAGFYAVSNSVNARAEARFQLEDQGVFLPFVTGRAPVVPTFGAEVPITAALSTLDLGKDANVHWLRWTLFDWSEIEAVQGSYDWSSVPTEKIQYAVDHGMQIIAIVKNVPSWARTSDGHKCGPIRSDALDEFAGFVNAAVGQYKDKIQYWEIGNEPDFPYADANDSMVFGCWGNRNDPYFGGGYFAEMLKNVYPQVKAADPKAQVLLGGLLLDCDPTYDAACTFGKFMEGVLRHNGQMDGENYFDIVSFHSYPYFTRDGVTDRSDPKWDERGGVVVGKIEFLQELLQAYGTSKPLFMTEFSLLCRADFQMCDPDDPTSLYDEFLEAQANWVVEGNVRNWVLGVDATIWYTLTPGWNNGGLIDANRDPKPAYNAFSFMTQELDKAYYLGPVPAASNLEGYRFRRSGTDVWVVWAWDRTSTSMPAPAGAQRVLDKYGTVLYDTGSVPSSLTVGSPMYIEVTP